MFGWEFPPLHNGGLGVACHGIVDGLIANRNEVFLVLPKVLSEMEVGNSGDLHFLNAFSSKDKLKILPINSGLCSPYLNESSYQNWRKCIGKNKYSIYGTNLLEEVHRYASKAACYAKKVSHDVIHAHDWLTAEAGLQAKKISNKPLVMHVHATEFDRSGENMNQHIYDLEKRGIEKSDQIIVVSDYTKNVLMKYYGVKEWKINVVHNAVVSDFRAYREKHHINKVDKIVLFLGRMTMQKGPDYFLKMAKKVLEKVKKVKFVMAGDGDMMQQIINMSVNLGIDKHILFAGFLTGNEIKRAYSMADLYVMPSVSEPFGIAPLEAISYGSPVLISKQSGVSEVIKNALRVDFWDVNEMANKVIAVLQYPELYRELKENSRSEAKKLNWKRQAAVIDKIYQKIIN